MKLLPVGMLSLLEALARVAQARQPEAWALARPRERAFLLDGAESNSFWRASFTGPASLAGRAYEVLRPLLANGELLAYVRGRSGPSVPIDPAAWSSSGTDRLWDVGGALTAIGGEVASGQVLLRVADLEAVLRGEPVSRPLGPINVQASNKGGRPPHRDLEPFWIEVCRLVESQALPREKAAYTKQMAQWASDRGAYGYSERAVQDKVRLLFEALGWG